LFGQTIQDLEYDLVRFSYSEKYSDKIDKIRKLQEIDPFNYLATEYLFRYYKEQNIDSVSIYFDNLIAKYPNKTEPYLLRADFVYFEYNFLNRDKYEKQKVKNLDLALRINSIDELVVFELAKVYYTDFIYPLEKPEEGIMFIITDEFGNEVIDSNFIAKEKEVKISTFENPADSALVYFYELWDLNEQIRQIIYYPIRQLECYLNKLENSKIPEKFEINFEPCFFLASYFTNLAEEWECDCSINYLDELEFGKRAADGLKIQLTALEENCLFNKHLQPNTVVYRFTWLRSFHNPIVIRIEKDNNKIMLYWKVGKGAGGYEPQGLKKKGKKKLSLKSWESFLKLVSRAEFDKLPNEFYLPMTDGASWVLEKKSSEEFKAHKTNWASEELEEACLFLLKNTKIKIKDKDIY